MSGGAGELLMSHAIAVPVRLTAAEKVMTNHGFIEVARPFAFALLKAKQRHRASCRAGQFTGGVHEGSSGSPRRSHCRTNISTARINFADAWIPLDAVQTG